MSQKAVSDAVDLCLTKAVAEADYATKQFVTNNYITSSETTKLINEIVYGEPNPSPSDISTNVTENNINEYILSSSSFTALTNEVNTISGQTTANTQNITNLTQSAQTINQNLEAVSGKADTNAANISELSGKVVNDYALKAEAVSGASYNSENKRIEFYSVSGQKMDSYIDATDLVSSGVVEKASVVDGNIVIWFAGADTAQTSGDNIVSISVSDIFDADNYYTTSQIDGMLGIIEGQPAPTVINTNNVDEYVFGNSAFTTVQGDISNISGDVVNIKELVESSAITRT